MIKHSSIVLARKPLSEKSIAENVLKHGTGGLNIDGSRIGDKTYTNDEWKKLYGTNRKDSSINIGNEIKKIDYDKLPNAPEGRFPANLMFDEEAGQVLDKQSGISKSVKGGKGKPIPREERFAEETINERGGFNDKGGASRFFYKTKQDD